MTTGAGDFVVAAQDGIEKQLLAELCGGGIRSDRVGVIGRDLGQAAEREILNDDLARISIVFDVY